MVQTGQYPRFPPRTRNFNEIIGKLVLSLPHRSKTSEFCRSSRPLRIFSNGSLPPTAESAHVTILVRGQRRAELGRE
jgi:hypothetical protein